MFIRFVTSKRDRQSGRRQGLFYAAYELADVGPLTLADRARLDELHEWFAKNMQEPSRAAVSFRPSAKALALSWFKEAASEHISHMRQFEAVLSDYGVHTIVLRTQRPGYVVYEDQHQVLALPFADTPS